MTPALFDALTEKGIPWLFMDVSAEKLAALVEEARIARVGEPEDDDQDDAPEPAPAVVAPQGGA